jgi:Uma2 family endonuclease
LGRLVGHFVAEHDLGFLTGADDLIEVMPDLVRGPDVCFTSWAKRPGKTVDSDQISGVIPDLAVEVLSPSNTPGEILRKLKEYFLGGVRLVWVIDPRKRAAVAYTTPDKKTVVGESGTLDGGDVLPGFRVPLANLFERLEKPARAKKGKTK